MVPGSPRNPFAAPPAPEQLGQYPSFHVLDKWRWTDTLPPGPKPQPPEADDQLGLVPGREFRLTTGACTNCRIPAPALWYFRNEIIAIPESAVSDQGADGHGAAPLLGYPLFAWIQAPQVIEHATLADHGRALSVNGHSIDLAITPRLATNNAYVDESTLQFFQDHRLRVRGVFAGKPGHSMFVARSFWPEDANISDPAALTLKPLKKGEYLGSLVQAQPLGSQGLFPVRLLWERHPGEPRHWAGQPVVAFLLSGSEAEDDLSLAGHDAVATGRFGPHGEWYDWLVNNFYPLDTISAKGILSAAVPMDNYLFEFNSGEAYYRPGYMLVAVLGHPTVADLIQQAMRQEMTRYYCRDLKFNLATQNSTAFSIDPLRALGWRIPTTGATSYLASLPAVPITALVELNLLRGVQAFRFLTEEQTRLMPRQAFEVLGQDLLYLASASMTSNRGKLTPFERMLADDVEAVLFVRIPQVPSSRPLGSYPLLSLIDYGARIYTQPGPLKRISGGGTRRLPKSLEHACRP